MVVALQSKVKTPNSPVNPPNGQHPSANSAAALTQSTPSLHNYHLTSSSPPDDQQLATVTSPAPTWSLHADADRPPSTLAGFVTPLIDVPAAAPQSPVFYSHGDYDNTPDNDDKATTTHPGAQRALGPSTASDSPSMHGGEHPTATPTPRTPLRSSEEESLDMIVAHLLDEVSPVSTTRAELGGPEASVGESKFLRWPQGDSLPRVDVRRTTVTVGAGDTVATEDMLAADENANIVKRSVVVPAASRSSAPVVDHAHSQAPPLIRIRKKPTPVDAANCSGDDGHPKSSESLVLDHQGSDLVKAGEVSSTNHDRSSEPTHGEMKPQNDSRRNEFEELEASAASEALPVRQTASLMDQFKALRLQVLTSTSQLLSCVSGTWKRGESVRSKLSIIKQLCVALAFSVGRLETFLQSTLSSPGLQDAQRPLVETAFTQIKKLQVVQASINTFIEALEQQQLNGGGVGGGVGGVADQRDLNVGGIIHLTKEIPGLVRTFAPLIEHLSTISEVMLSPQCSSDATTLRVGATTRDVTRAVVPKIFADSSSVTGETEKAKEGSVRHEDKRSLPRDVVAAPSVNQRRTNPDVLNAGHSAVNGNKLVIADSAQKNIDPRVTVDVVETPSAASNHKTSTSQSDERGVSTKTGNSNGRRVDVTSEPPILPEKLDNSTAPPTPPPKVRVASRYHATLGITNSLTTAPSASGTAKTTTGHDDDVDDVMLAVEQTKASDDDKCGRRHQQTQREGGICDEAPIERAPAAAVACGEEVTTADPTTAHFRFPRAADAQPVVVLRRRPTATSNDDDLSVDVQRHSRVSESELQTPDFRASGVSQTTVEQLEALQRQANAQTVLTHTDASAGFDRFDPPVPEMTVNSHLQTQRPLSTEDRRLLMFYCDQMAGHWNVLDSAVSAFFHCMDRRQPPKVFVSHSKFVIVAGHKMAYLGDVLAKNIDDKNARDWIVVNSNHLCDRLKMAVRATKEAALAYPGVPAQQLMVDCIKDVTDWAVELKEVVDRLAYLGTPEHVLA